MSRKNALWPRLVFAAAAVLALVFALRLGMAALHWAGAPPADPVIEGWMTPRLVARGWHVPPDVLGTALALPQDGSGRRLTLQQIADSRGISVQIVIAELQFAIDSYRAGQ